MQSHADEPWREYEGPPPASRRSFEPKEPIDWALTDPNFRAWREGRGGTTVPAAEEPEDDPLNPRIFQRPARRAAGPRPAGVQWGLVLPVTLGAIALVALLVVLVGRSGPMTSGPATASATGQSQAEAGSDASVFSAPATVTPTATLEPGWILLPAMDDAADQPFNGQLIHLEEQPALDLGVWGGNEGALCQYQLKDGRNIWVPCWRMEKPNATPMPTPTPRPIPPTPTPRPPCFYAKGLNGEYEQCGWNVTQADVDALAGPTIAPPAPTMCASSDDGTVQMCGGTSMDAMRKEANYRAEIQRAATATAQAASP